MEGRALYLRGSFNVWAAADAQRLHWACDRYTLVTALAGEHHFKIGDEGWSADADFGQDPQQPQRLALRGADIRHHFGAGGVQRITLNVAEPRHPQLTIEDCPSGAPPLGATTLFLRGSMNNWAALEDYAFRYQCDAYYLNVTLKGAYEFKIADSTWSDAASFGAGAGAALRAGAGAVMRSFDGEHTLRLAWSGGEPQLAVGPRTFADPTVRPVADPVARSLQFDSRSPRHKPRFGAVPAGTALDFAVEAAPGVARLTLVVERRVLEGNQEVLQYHEVARVPLQRNATGTANGVERWTGAYHFAEVAVYGYWFEAELADGRRFALQNNRQPLYWTREKGTGGLGTVEVLEGAAARESVRRFRQTVYDPGFRVPAWAADAVYYYVFPERFRNGDRRNDPQPGRTRSHDGTVEYHTRWTDSPFKPGSGDGSDARHSNDFFGGDLQGLIDKLDTIRDLGANTLYLTPIFKAASNHKYDTADYHQVDPGFGSNADFVRLTRAARQRGIRVLVDASLNHTGSDSVYFDRFGNYGGSGAFAFGRVQPQSAYASWYRFDPAQPDADRQYRGWVGVADLPELDKGAASFRNFAYGSPGGVMQRWLDRGAAGWRMDVAPWVPDDFWREWRAALKRHRPDALTVAETWFDASKFLLGDMFDSTMNYIFRNAVLDYAAGGDARSALAQLEWVREAYPPQAWGALMNLLSTHDQARSLHVLGWDGAAGADPERERLAKQRFRLALLLQMTYPGAPAVYYGDEVGVTGGDDPYNRASYPWADQGGRPDRALQRAVRALIHLRQRHAVLRRGTLGPPLWVNEHSIVWLRRHGRDLALVATNNSEQPQTVQVHLPAGLRTGVWRDALGSARVRVRSKDPILQFTVPAHFGRVLLARTARP